MGDCLAKETKVDQRPCVGKGYLLENSCPFLPLPLTLAWQQLEIWGLSRPLSWEKRDRTAYIHSEKLLFHLSLCLSLSLSLSRRHTKKKARCFVFAHSLIQLQIEMFITNVLPLQTYYIIICFISSCSLFVKLFHYLFKPVLLNFFVSLTHCLPFYPLLFFNFSIVVALSVCLSSSTLMFSPFLSTFPLFHISGISLPLLGFAGMFKLWQTWERHSAP